MKRKEHPSTIKLENLKANRVNKLVKKLLEIDLKGVEHRVHLTKDNRADLTVNDGKWITDAIRQIIVKHNYAIDQVKKLQVKNFSPAELEEVKSMDV